MGVRHNFNLSFFDKWSSKMAYVIGFIYADGSIDRSPKIRASYLSVTSTDKDIIVNIRNVLDSKHTIVTIPPSTPTRKKKYLLRIGSNQLCDKLEKYGLYPRKSLTAKLPVIPPAMLSHFVRGYFDGDGCVHIEKQKKRGVTRLRVIFTSGSQCFLFELENRLKEKLKLKPRKVYLSHRSFQLSYSTKDSFVLFDFMYKKPYDGLYLKRKKQLFERFKTA